MSFFLSFFLSFCVFLAFSVSTCLYFNFMSLFLARIVILSHIRSLSLSIYPSIHLSLSVFLWSLPPFFFVQLYLNKTYFEILVFLHCWLINFLAPCFIFFNFLFLSFFFLVFSLLSKSRVFLR